MSILKKINKLAILTILLCCTAFSGALIASPLSDARDVGLIIELETGYVAAAETASVDITALVEKVNQSRKAAYEKIAEKNGITAVQVGYESYKKRYPNQ